MNFYFIFMEKILSRKNIVATLVIAAYLIFLGGPWAWIISPIVALYGNFLERKVSRSSGVKKYILQFLLYCPIMGVLVAASEFVQKISNGNSLAIGTGICFGLLMCGGAFARDRLRS